MSRTPRFMPNALCASLILLGASGALAQTSTPSTTTPPARTGAATGTTGGTAAGSATLAAGDRNFVEKAAMGGLAEVALGSMAQQKASNEQVKQFGARMVKDHGAANDELKQIASSKGLQVPASLDRKHQDEADRLQKMSGADFDKAYMSHMVDDHKQDVAEFKKQASGGKDSDVKGFAAKTLPTLEEHLKLAQAANDAVKKGGK